MSNGHSLKENQVKKPKRGGKEIKTRSSNSSTSPLKLFVNPFNLAFPNVTIGLNLDDNMDSKNPRRGYTIGIPV
jgi:hypothetical protein